MILSLHAQAQLFLLTVLLGGGMGLFYDGLRVFRHALRHNAFWVQAEDGLFWLLAVFLVFCVMLHANAGEIRFFTILGLFGGMGLYFLTLSRMVLAVSDKIISAVKYARPFWAYCDNAVSFALACFSPPCEKNWRILRKTAEKTIAKR